MGNFNFNTIDAIVVFVYIFGIIIYGLYHRKNKTSDDYFLAGRNSTWPVVGISLFAANISSSTLIGLAGAAYSTGISVYNYEWLATVVLVFFSIFFLPFYLKSKVYTMPEFLEKRFDFRSRYYFSIMTLIGNVLVDTAAALYAGSLILKMMFPEVDTYLVIAFLALATAAYTIPGGLSSVMQTEVIQAILLIICSIILTFLALDKVGGWDYVMANLDEALLKRGGDVIKTKEDMMSLVKPITDETMPWTGLLFGAPILGFYFWATNQFMVQRSLSAKNLQHGRLGALFAGLLKLPVLYFMVFPGTIAIILYPNIKGDEVYPTLLSDLMPAGLFGLAVAGLLAAMSSSISATLNSASTLITMDFVTKINPKISNKGMVRSGQIATIILVTLAALWTPQIGNFKNLFEYLQIVIAFTCPPVVAVFIMGLFNKRTGADAAFIGLMSGFVLSLTFLISEIYKVDWQDIYIIVKINEIQFLHRAAILFFIPLFITYSMTYLTPPPSEEQANTLIWKKEHYDAETKELEGTPWYTNYRTLSVILILITIVVVGMYW